MKIIKWIVIIIVFVVAVFSYFHPKTVSLLIFETQPTVDNIYDIYDEYTYAFAKVRTATAPEVMKLLGDPKLILVDVRTEQERSISTIPGAISREVFEQRYIEKPKRLENKTVITFCSIGVRSGLFAKKLHDKDIRVRNLRGALLAWVHHKGKLVTPNGERTNRLHVFSEEWKLVPEGYEPVW